MTTSGSYDVRKPHRDANAEIQRLARQARLGWEEEARNLPWFGVKGGMSLIELGSGPVGRSSPPNRRTVRCSCGTWRKGEVV